MGKINDGLYSSASGEWETPPALFEELDREFHFQLDVCATPENTKCLVFYTMEQDGLLQDWGRLVCWMNPPYGREISKWVYKAWLASTKGATVVCLIPARTDTRWWHRYVMLADEIRLIQGRVKFVGGQHSAPFPSAIVVFKPTTRKPAKYRQQWVTIYHRLGQWVVDPGI